MVDVGWISTQEAAALLGVKAETLYAYVSRGLLARDRTDGSRTSRFRRTDVEELAQRSRSRSRPSAESATGRELLIESQISMLDPAGRLFYRGRDAASLAGVWSYERVAEWLWRGVDEPVPVWIASKEAVKVGRRVQAAMPTEATIAERLRVAVAALAPTDPMRHDRRPEAVAVTARGLIAGMVASLATGPSTPGISGDAGSIAAALWRSLSPRRPRRVDLALMDRALVLLADHELAASTFAARVAAATWTDPYLVVLAGMSALGGVLHGGASGAVVDLLRDVQSGIPAERAVGDRLRETPIAPGFGHPIYTGVDPRAVDLLAALERARLPVKVGRAARDVLDVVASRGGPSPNIDFAIAVFTEAAGMATDAGEAIFAVARTAGWIAHGVEEYSHPLRYRPRATYTGPPPDRE